MRSNWQQISHSADHSHSDDDDNHLSSTSPSSIDDFNYNEPDFDHNESGFNCNENELPQNDDIMNLDVDFDESLNTSLSDILHHILPLPSHPLQLEVNILTFIDEVDKNLDLFVDVLIWSQGISHAKYSSLLDILKAHGLNLPSHFQLQSYLWNIIDLHSQHFNCCVNSCMTYTEQYFNLDTCSHCQKS